MNDSKLSAILEKFPTGGLCNAHPGVKALPARIKPLAPGTKLSGPARTGQTQPGQNAVIHRAVVLAHPGEVLVIDGKGSMDYGAFGDILALACKQRKIKGLVFNGTVRDTPEIKEMGFPVFCLGANPNSTKKEKPGRVNISIKIDDVKINPGDFIVGDDDGVVVVPRILVFEVIGLAQKVLEREEVIKNQLKKGKTTCEIFKITP